MDVGREGGGAEAEVLALELLGGEIAELGDAVDGGGVEALVAAGAADVGLEDGESVGVLLRIGVALAEPLEEGREVVVLRAQQVVAVDHLPDELILVFGDGDGDGAGKGDGDKDEEDEGAGDRHGRINDLLNLPSSSSKHMAWATR